MGSLGEQLADKGYLSPNGLVAYLHEIKSIKAVSYSTIRRMIENGEIKAEKVGSQLRITKAEIDRFVENGGGEQPPPSPVDTESPAAASELNGFEQEDDN